MSGGGRHERGLLGYFRKRVNDWKTRVFLGCVGGRESVILHSVWRHRKRCKQFTQQDRNAVVLNTTSGALTLASAFSKWWFSNWLSSIEGKLPSWPVEKRTQVFKISLDIFSQWKIIVSAKHFFFTSEFIFLSSICLCFLGVKCINKGKDRERSRSISPPSRWSELDRGTSCGHLANASWRFNDVVKKFFFF